jgi:hypothetical protein
MIGQYINILPDSFKLYLASSSSAGGQLEQPSEVNSSKTTKPFPFFLVIIFLVCGLFAAAIKPEARNLN